MLFGIGRTAVVWAALTAVVVAGASHGADSRIALDIVNRAAPGETGPLTVALTGTNLVADPLPLHQLFLRLSYDRERLAPTAVDAAPAVAATCDLLFYDLPIDSLWPGHSTLWVGLRVKPAGDPPLLTDTTTDLVSVTFDRLDSLSPLPDSVDLAFYWLESGDNLLWIESSDTLLASNRVFAPDSADITCTDSSLPCRCGLPDSILDRLNAELAPAVRGLDFQGLRVRFDQPTGVEREAGEEVTPSSPVLYPNYPNPFNASTRIRFALSRSGDYRVTIINPLGQVVRSFGGYASAGEVSLFWDGCDIDHRPVAAGIYLCRLETAQGRATTKMVLLK